MRGVLTLISLLFCAVSIAQTTPYDDLRLASTDSDRLIAHKAISTHLIDLFTTSSSIEDLKLNVTDWPFGFATSREDEDWALVLTWNSENTSRVQDYGGMAVFTDTEKESGFSWVELIHDKRESVGDEGRSYRVDDWTGALYYDMIIQYDGETPVYTLLGWDGADGLVTRKIIETMSISNGIVRIGTPYISRPDGLKKRHVLEYADVLQVILNYEEDNDRIVIDHLAPSDPSLEGQTAFYGPTLDYDAYTWENDKWVLSFNVKVRNDKDKQRYRPYNEPRPKR